MSHEIVPADEDPGESTDSATTFDNEAGRDIAFAQRFLTEVVRLRVVQVDRAKFLQSELHKRGIGRD